MCSRVLKIWTTVLALCLFLQCCFSLSSNVNPEICSLNRIRTTTHCQQIHRSKGWTQGEVFRDKETHGLSPFPTCHPHHGAIAASLTHKNSLRFPIWWHVVFQSSIFHVQSLFAITEGLIFFLFFMLTWQASACVYLPMRVCFLFVG